MVRLIRTLPAMVVLAALVAGPPWALLRYIGNPWPAEGVSLSAPITDNALIGVLAVIVWVLWAQLMACIVVEALAAFTRDRIQLRVPFTLGVQQHLARRLLTTILVATISTPVAAGTAMAATGTSPIPSTSVASHGAADPSHRTGPAPSSTAAEVQTRAQQIRVQGEGPTTEVTVMRLDSLWSIAERHLEDGGRWQQIAALNEGRTMNDGTRFTSGDQIKPGWQLRVPAAPAAKTTAAKTTAAKAAQAVEPRPAGHQITVRKGDTLSEIARTELEDARAYPRLFQASKDLDQPGGRRLTDPDLILPGWKIQIPGTTTASGAKAPPDAAQPSTGSTAAPEVAPTPDRQGESGADTPPAEQAPPSVVGPPASAQFPAQPEIAPQAPAAPQTQPAEGNQTKTSTAAEQQIESSHAVEAGVEDDPGWPIRTVGGVCALLAGALIGLITLRRNRQRRHREPGQQVPLPGAAAEAVERQIRAVADEFGLDTVDRALRVLAADCAQAALSLPELHLARLTDERLELTFAAAAELAAPWETTSDPATWTLSAPAAADLADTGDLPAPWPALVTLGHDHDNGVVLVNLAEGGTFGVVGGEHQIREAVTALTLELGTSPWASGLSLTTVGSLDELAEVIETDRLRYVPTLTAAGLIEEITDPAGDRACLVIDAGRVITRDQHDRLRQRGAVVVTHGWFAGDAALHVTDTDQARLLPHQLDLAPQLVDPQTYQGLLEVLRASLLTPSTVDSRPGERVIPFDPAPARPPEDTSEHSAQKSSPAGTKDSESAAGDGTPASAGPGTGNGFRQLEDLLTGDGVNATNTGSAPAEPVATAVCWPLHPHDDAVVTETLDPAPATADADAPAGEPAPGGQGWTDTVAETGDLTPTPGDVDSAATVSETTPSEPAEAGAKDEAWPLTHPEREPHPLLMTGHPVIRLVGPVVDIIGAAADAPTSATHLKVCTRIAAYLALTPATSRPSLIEAVWGGQRIAAGTVDSRISNLRAWLGTNPDTGQRYLPQRSLQLNDVTTDWDIFVGLVGPKPAGAPTAALEQALSLVRGRPLEGEAKHYGFAEYTVMDMMNLIVDTAYELARRRYFEASWRRAGAAAALGVLLEPGNERLWRIRILAAHSAGKPQEVTEAIDRMHARISELGFDLEEETTDLLQALAQRDSELIEQVRQAL